MRISFNLCELQSIIKILEDDEGKTLNNVYLDYSDSTLVIRGKRIELYARSSFQGTLTIARIQLNHKHQGIGIKLFNEIIKYATNKGFNKIDVESVMTDEMHKFCIKYGFKEKLYSRFETLCSYEMYLN